MFIFHHPPCHKIINSVTRQLYQQTLTTHTRSCNSRFPVCIPKKDPNSSENDVTITYNFNFFTALHELDGPWLYTWGDFTSSLPQRYIWLNRNGDPNYPQDRVPDVIFFSPGYHASQLNSTEYGAALDKELALYQETMTKNNWPVSLMHVFLNMMPASWKIPKEYAHDRPHRTEVKEYRKNLAIISTVQKYDFVKSIVDTFSIELPFNGKKGEGNTAHRDAVHVADDHFIMRVVSDRLIDLICSS